MTIFMGRIHCPKNPPSEWASLSLFYEIHGFDPCCPIEGRISKTAMKDMKSDQNSDFENRHVSFSAITELEKLIQSKVYFTGC